MVKVNSTFFLCAALLMFVSADAEDITKTVADLNTVDTTDIGNGYKLILTADANTGFIKTLNVNDGAMEITGTFLQSKTGSVSLTNATVTGKNNLWLGKDAGDAPVLNINGGSMTLGEYLTVGYLGGTGTSSAVISNASVTSNGFCIGYNSPGEVTLNSTTYQNNNNLIVGENNSGILNVTDSTLTCNSNAYVGLNGSSSGKMTINNNSNVLFKNGVTVNKGGLIIRSGSLTIPNNNTTGISINSGSGYFEQTGGTVNTPKITLGDAAAAGKSALYSLQGGTLETEEITSAGMMEFTGGELYVRNVSGTLNQTGGTLVVGSQKQVLWTRYDMGTIANGYPGFSVQDTNKWWGNKPEGSLVPDQYGQRGYGVTQEENDAFWNNIATNAVTIKSGSGNIGDGGLGGNFFATIYEGRLSVDQDGSYTFNMQADDGGFLIIDGVTVLNSSTMLYGNPWSKLVSETIPLTAGEHDFEYRLYQGWGGSGSIGQIQWGLLGGDMEDLRTSDNLSAPLCTTIPMTGDYNLSEGGALVMDVDLSSGKSDVLKIAGNFNAEGTLILNLVGLSPAGMDINLFDVDGDMDMDFSSVILNSRDQPLAYLDASGFQNGGDGVLHALRIPEPSTWALLGLGFAILLWRRRRNYTKSV